MRQINRAGRQSWLISPEQDFVLALVKNRFPFTSTLLSIKIHFQHAFASVPAQHVVSEEKRMFYLKIAETSSIFLFLPAALTHLLFPDMLPLVPSL